MTSIGAAILLEKYNGSSLSVAEALLRGELNPGDEMYASQVISPMIMEAAKFRVEMGLKKKRKKKS